MIRGLGVIILWLGFLFLASHCDDGDEESSLVVAWTFDSGDCASNGVETVRVAATPSGGEPLTGEATCDAQSVDLGSVGAGSYSIVAQGLDAGGVVRAENFGTSVTISSGVPSIDVDVTLHPKASRVTVSWNGCPASVILPYFITIYNPPDQAGGELIDDVTSVQESCSAKIAALENVPPGNYIVELDSRAVTPKIYATQSITVIAGEDADVAFDVP